MTFRYLIWTILLTTLLILPACGGGRVKPAIVIQDHTELIVPSDEQMDPGPLLDLPDPEDPELDNVDIGESYNRIAIGYLNLRTKLINIKQFFEQQQKLIDDANKAAEKGAKEAAK